MAMEEITARIGLDSSGFTRGLDMVNNTLTGFKQDLTDLGSRIRNAFTVGALLKLAKEAVQYASDMNDAAEATRTGVEEYQVLAQAARESGASIQQLDQALIKSTLSGEKAAEGNKEMSAAFKALNIDVEKFNQLPTERKLEAIGAAYNAAGASQDAYNAVAEILGTKSAPRLISALQQLGTEGFDAVRERVEAAGLVLSKLEAQSLDALADKMESWKTKSLIFVGDVVLSWEKLIKTLAGFADGKTFTQIVNEDMDSARIEARVQAIAQLVAEGMIEIRQQATDEFGNILIPEKIISKVKEVGDAQMLIEQRVTDIVNQRRQVEAEVTAEKQEQFAETSRQAELEQRNADTAHAIKLLEDGRAVLRLKEMSDKERLAALEELRREAVERVQNMELLGEGTAKEKEAIVKRVLDLEGQIANTKDKIAQDEKRSQDEREKKEKDLLELMKEQAALAEQMANRNYDLYGRSSGDLATGGGSNSTLGRMAADADRLSDTAQRQFDELARARARAAAGDQDAAREVDRLQRQFDETEARRQGLEDQITEAQGGTTGDPLVDKMEDVRKEIEDLRDDLDAA